MPQHLEVEIANWPHERYACQLERIEFKINAILELLQHPGKAVDLGIVFGSQPSTQPKGSDPMASNKKASGPALKHPCMSPKGSPKGGAAKAVMPGVTLTDPLPKSITLQPLDAQGNVVVLTPADAVKGTLDSDSPNLVIAQGADSVNFVATIPANTPAGSVANLAATLKGTIQGAAADLTASVAVTINVPPSPVAVDLSIIFA